MEMTDERWLKAIDDIGEAAAADYNEELYGKFGFSVTSPLGQQLPVLTATYEHALNEDEPAEGNDDYAKPEKRRWLLIPFGDDTDYTVQGPPRTNIPPREQK